MYTYTHTYMYIKSYGSSNFILDIRPYKCYTVFEYSYFYRVLKDFLIIRLVISLLVGHLEDFEALLLLLIAQALSCADTPNTCALPSLALNVVITAMCHRVLTTKLMFSSVVDDWNCVSCTRAGLALPSFRLAALCGLMSSLFRLGSL